MATKRYGASSIPAGTTLEDWPIGHDDLEPYYDTVEYEIGVSGKAGNLQGKIDLRGNVFEGPRRREYPMPPLRDTDFTAMMMAAGWGFSHEAPNLGVLGGSVMGTNGARNPTLTLQALAWRTAEHLLKSWKTIGA